MVEKINSILLKLYEAAEELSYLCDVEEALPIVKAMEKKFASSKHKEEECALAWEEYYAELEDLKDLFNPLEFEAYEELEICNQCSEMWKEHEYEQAAISNLDENAYCEWIFYTAPIRRKANYDFFNEKEGELVVFSEEYPTWTNAIKNPSKNWKASLELYKYYYACINKFSVRWNDQHNPLLS